MDHLRHVIRNYPVIDNHAHNLLSSEHLGKYDFLTSTTEAQGEALQDTPSSLSHLRALKQLKELYGAASDDWESINTARLAHIARDPNGLIRTCLAGIHTILIDDGLDLSNVKPYPWHDQFVTTPVKRIVRIEAVAAEVMRYRISPSCKEWQAKNILTRQAIEQAFKNFRSEMLLAIGNAISDNAVVGFKSVICYRTGLNVKGPDPTGNKFWPAWEKYVLDSLENDACRLESKPLNDWLVRLLLIELSDMPKRNLPAKPLQFHTGLGDNDINLILSDPAHLQPLIEEFPEVPFIILHSSYPYTRQAGYLATVYKNAYLDVGEVFPMISRDGQEKVIRQALELTPGTKILWSTDGHHFPETYWLANKQFRLALEKILVEYVQEGDLSTDQATQLARDIYFNNSNHIYNLNLKPPSIQPPIEQPPSDISSGFPLPGGRSLSSQSPSLQSLSVQSPSVRSLNVQPRSVQPRAFPPGVAQTIDFAEKRPVQPNSSDGSVVVTSYNLTIWQNFERENPSPSYIYVQWLDRMAQLRCRILPVREFQRLVESGEQLGMSRGNTGTLQNDAETAVMNPVGQVGIRPDLRSLRPTHPFDTLRKPGKTTGTVMASWCDDSGRPLDYCHRSQVQRLSGAIKHEFGIDMLIGFEIEVVFFKRGEDGKSFVPFTQGEGWSTMNTEQWEQLGFFGEVMDALADMGIHLQQLHAESAQGQYEFVLPPLPPLAAIDTLIQARTAIQQLAHRHNPPLRATFHPIPVPGIGIGTGAHAHISLTPPEHEHCFFVAGVLEHLRAICAFSLPEAASYDRVMDNAWTGGTWVSWGTQNRETPLRKIGKGGRWEVKCLDGFANMYLAIGAILAAGLLGLRRGDEGSIDDCNYNPSKLNDAMRDELGIREQLPRRLEDALEALKDDEDLAVVLGEEMVSDYLVMKEAEQMMLEKMDEEERRVWLIERY